MKSGLGWRRHRWRWWWVVATWLLPAALTATALEQRFANQPSPQTAVIGTTVVLPCRVINKVGELQWTKDDFGLGNERELYAFKRYHMIGSDEEGDFSLRISPVTLEDEAYFQCQVTGWRDIPGVRSQTAKLTVYVPPEPPIITSGPLVTTTAGVDVYLECISRGGKPAAEIQWLDVSGRVVTEGVRYTTELMQDGQRSNARSTFKFLAKRQHHNSVFTCSASNPAIHHPNTVQVRVEVRYAPEVTITHDQDGYREGETATLTCSANANPSALTYRWYRNGNLVTNNNSTHFVVRDVTRDSNLEDITCEVSNEVGTSKKITRLAIHYGPSFVLTPSDQYADLGDNVTLRCQVESSPSPTIVWINQRSQTVVGKGQEVNLVADRDTVGYYLCIAKVEGFPEISAIVGLFFKGPPNLRCERQQWGKQGDNVALECLITDASVTSLLITWARQGQLLDLEDDRYEPLEEVTTLGIRHTLVIRNALLEDFGGYNCSVQNEYGMDFFEVELSRKKTLPILGLVGVAGGIALLLAVITVVIVCAKRPSPHQNDSKSSELQEKTEALQANDHNSTANDSDLKVDFDQRTGSSLSNKDATAIENDGWDKDADHSSTPTFLTSTNSYLYSDTFAAVPTKMNGHLNSNGGGMPLGNYSEVLSSGGEAGGGGGGGGGGIVGGGGGGGSDRQHQIQQQQSQRSSPVIGFIKGSNGVANPITGGGTATVGSSPQTPQSLVNASTQVAMYPGYSSQAEPSEDNRRFSQSFTNSLTNQSYKTFSGSVPLALHVNSRSNGTPGNATSTIPRLGIPVDPSQYIMPPRSQALQGALATHV
ncbi:irregular chiasm C-roughest protein-like [Macrobrachium rosenbergii]|uniref:irregular chiasm C-roughest protein-like n=1 Tax=Macrobrachium rosenbergii TaxID=79674 RepID=UPI0034D50416